MRNRKTFSIKKQPNQRAATLYLLFSLLGYLSVLIGPTLEFSMLFKLPVRGSHNQSKCSIFPDAFVRPADNPIRPSESEIVIVFHKMSFQK